MSRAQRQARRAAGRALEREKRKRVRQREQVRTRLLKAHCPDCKNEFKKGSEASQCKGCSQFVCVGCVTRGNHKCPGYNLLRR